MATLSWKPRRRGNRYCSPGCGRGCTWDEYESAILAASKLADSLGPAWHPHVWENVGWYYRAQLLTDSMIVEVSPPTHGADTFWCSIRTDIKQWTARASTGQEAFREAFMEMVRQSANLASDVERLQELTPE